jgi:hypothetical protein
LQNELNDAKKLLKIYHKIRWLSRWQAITTLCDSLESVLVYLHDAQTSRDDGSTALLYAKLREFKFIYILYFLADILKMFSTLSKIFQSKLVDISSIGSIVKTEMASRIHLTLVLDFTLFRNLGPLVVIFVVCLVKSGGLNSIALTW